MERGDRKSDETARIALSTIQKFEKE